MEDEIDRMFDSWIELKELEAGRNTEDKLRGEESSGESPALN